MRFSFFRFRPPRFLTFFTRPERKTLSTVCFLFYSFFDSSFFSPKALLGICTPRGFFARTRCIGKRSSGVLSGMFSPPLYRLFRSSFRTRFRPFATARFPLSFYAVSDPSFCPRLRVRFRAEIQPPRDCVFRPRIMFPKSA